MTTIWWPLKNLLNLFYGNEGSFSYHKDQPNGVTTKCESVPIEFIEEGWIKSGA